MKDLLKRVISWSRCRYTISKLRVKDGDVLILKDRQGVPVMRDWRFIEKMLDVLKKRGTTVVEVIYLGKDCDLQGLQEEDMNRVGWFRKTSNPGRDELLLNAYRELRKWDGRFGRAYSMTRLFDAEVCIRRLQGEEDISIVPTGEIEVSPNAEDAKEGVEEL